MSEDKSNLELFNKAHLWSLMNEEYAMILKRLISRLGLVALCLMASLPAAAQGFAVENGGKLLLTRGITGFEGTAGGALTPWAVIAGNETENGVGATAHYTHIATGDYETRSAGFGVGFFDRLEVSYSRLAFDTQDVGTALGLGQGFTFHQDIVGAKVKLAGDAILAQDSWLPQISAGVFYKNVDRSALQRALGATDDDGLDIYVSATKLFLRQSLLVNTTLRHSSSRQTGILGYGNNSAILPEFSVGYLLSRHLVIGGEYRFKPDSLGFSDEDDWFDIFAVYAPNDNITLTVAYGNLGDVVTFENQQGIYASIQVGF